MTDINSVCYMCMCVWLCVTTGLFEVSCKVNEHYIGGMRQQYRVKNCGQSASAHHSAPTAYYYISAEEIEWDYSPSRTWELQNFNTTAEERYTQSPSIPTPLTHSFIESEKQQFYTKCY